MEIEEVSIDFLAKLPAIALCSRTGDRQPEQRINANWIVFDTAISWVVCKENKEIVDADAIAIVIWASTLVLVPNSMYPISTMDNGIYQPSAELSD